MNTRTILFLVAAVALVLVVSPGLLHGFGSEAVIMMAGAAVAPAFAAFGWWRSGGRIWGAVAWTVAGPIVLSLAAIGFVLTIFSEYRAFGAAAMVIPAACAVAGGRMSPRRAKGALTGALLGMGAQVVVALAVALVWYQFDPPKNGPRGGIGPDGLIMLILILAALWIPAGAIIGALVAAGLTLTNGGAQAPGRLSNSQRAAIEACLEADEERSRRLP